MSIERKIDDLRRIIEGNLRPRNSVAGQVALTVISTAYQISTLEKQGRITVKNPTSNTGNVYIGTIGVSASTGHLLEPGEQVVIDTINLSKWWALSAAGSESITYLGEYLSK